MEDGDAFVGEVGVGWVFGEGSAEVGVGGVEGCDGGLSGAEEFERSLIDEEHDAFGAEGGVATDFESFAGDDVDAGSECDVAAVDFDATGVEAG